jgi:serine/threonine protein kinase
MEQINVEKLKKNVINEYEFRKEIQGKKKKTSYLILNEIFSSEYLKTFSGIRLIKHENPIKPLEPKYEVIYDEPLSIKYIDKNFLQNKIFKFLGIKEERGEKFLENIKKNFNKTDIQHKNLLKIYDIIEDENGIYFVEELCEYSLEDYIKMTVTPFKNSKFPIETKLLPIIIEMLSVIQYVHEKGLYFGTLLSPSEIYVKETLLSADETKSAFSIKMPNPMVSLLYTLISIFSAKLDSNFFQSFYPPEFYNKFFKNNDKNDLNEIEINLNSLQFINDNFDKWALGYLIYYMLFDEVPFSFVSANEAIRKMKDPNFYYEIFPWKISYVSLNLISSCLKYDEKKRIQNMEFRAILNNYISLSDEFENFVKDMKDRTERMNKHKDPVKFNFYNTKQTLGFEN